MEMGIYMDDVKVVKNVKFKELKPIDCDDYYKYALMPYWMYAEAIFLSMDIDAFYGKKNDNDDEAVVKYASEYNFRCTLLDRALEINVFDDIGQAHLDRPWLIKFSPIEFTNWAKDNFPSFPPKLLSAVIEHQNKLSKGQLDPLADRADKTLTHYHENDSDIDKELWDKAVNLVVGDRIDNINETDNPKIKNALQNGTKTWPFMIKSVYKALKHISDGCNCISLALEKIILSEMVDELADFSDKQLVASEGTKLAYTVFLRNAHDIPKLKENAVKSAVKLAMSSDSNSKSRIYKKMIKENGNVIKIWDPSWHRIKCEIHPTSSNSAPTKKMSLPQN